MTELLTVDPDALRAQVPQIEQFLRQFGDRLPDEISAQLEALKDRLG
jgi:phosphoenolpyruvate carboxykinase (GTP)